MRIKLYRQFFPNVTNYDNFITTVQATLHFKPCQTKLWIDIFYFDHRSKSRKWSLDVTAFLTIISINGTNFTETIKS